MKEETGYSIIHESEYKHLEHHLPSACVMSNPSILVSSVNDLPFTVNILRGKWLRRHLCANVDFLDREICVYDKDMYSFFKSWGRTHGYQKLYKEWHGAVDEK